MASIYGDQHRKLQDSFDTRKLADRIEEITVKQEFDEDSKGFIETRDMFFLSTIDHTGRPTVSYKGGDPGFVNSLIIQRWLFQVMTETACICRWAIS